MNSRDLLERYDEMWRLSQQMLEFARQGDWDRLIELEQSRAAIGESLAAREDESLWRPAEREKKRALIRSILDADTEIKALTQSWMGELQEILGSIDTEKKLHKAYGTP